MVADTAGLVAIALVGCSSGGEEETAVEATTTQPPSTATATARPSVVSGSSGATGSTSGTGTLEVRVTDAPDPSITAVFVTTDNVEVSVAGQGWLTVIDEKITFELLALEGVEAVLGTAELPVGKYTQVRLSVPEVQIEKDGELVTADVPSGTIKLVGNFELVADEKTFISLDFEVDKSLIDRNRQGFLFKPVIKLVVGEPGEAGSATVALTGKPEPTPVATPTEVPTAVVPTATAIPPTAVPQSTATPLPPTATPDALGAFFLDIVEPVDGEAVVTTPTFDIVGRTSIYALVIVNDTFADVAVDGTFTVTVALDEGPNEIEVVASTAAGEESSIVVLIVYETGA
jgi:hypothetical protein